MLDFSGLNIVAIVVAWAITVFIGSIWYSPFGFGKQWSRLSGVDMLKLPKKIANKAIIFVAISSLLLVTALAVMINTLQPVSAMDALFMTLVIWFGFTAITTIGNTLYQKLSLSFWALNAAYFLVVMLISAVILYAW